MSKIKNRILELIEFMNISKREFCRKIDVSHTYLNGDSEIGSDKLEIIISVFPNLSLEWLITGRGEMFSNIPEKANIYQDNSADYLEILKINAKTIESQQMIIKDLTEKLNRKGDVVGARNVAL